MKPLYILLVGLALSSCQTTKGAHTTRGKFLGKETKQTISIEESRLNLPPQLKDNVKKIISVDVGVNRYSEKLYGTDFYFRLEQIYRGLFDISGNGNLLKFAKGVKDDDGSLVPVDAIKLTRQSGVVYGTFASKSNKPCLLARLAVGKNTTIRNSDAIINGVFCGKPGEHIDDVVSKTLSELNKIKML